MLFGGSYEGITKVSWSPNNNELDKNIVATILKHFDGASDVASHAGFLQIILIPS